MSRIKRNCLLICMVIICFGIVFSLTKLRDFKTKEEVHYEIYDRLALGADPKTGMESITTNDFEIDESFESHLPIVVIECDDEIPNAYHYDTQAERFVLRDGVEPYVSGQISVINNDNCINRLSDSPEISSNMRIKYRGNSSLVYAKHQYRINLTDEEGNASEEDMLGMGKETDWILNISMIDSTLIRNYMVYSICHNMSDYTPDVRFCEVVLKNEAGFQYEGVYLLMEVVEQGKDRVDIKEYSGKKDYSSYLVRRDRYDEEGLMLDTYATKNELCYGYLDLRYPKSDKLNDKIVNYITDDLSQIEKVIFSDKEREFLKYPSYIDEDSFVDYFLINEFFANYDAGNNSTFMYKDVRGKLSIGPVWDYDNIADNMGEYLLDPSVISFHGQPWFNKLVQSESFCKKLEKRYAQLRKQYFSDEYINTFIDDTTKYLGNAQKRDWSRWSEYYTSDRFKLIEDSDGIVIDRNYNDYENIVQRLKDVLNTHGEYIPAELERITLECRYKDAYRTHAGYAILFLILFFSSIIIGRRKI
ncbi:MAG: CotH kinase family protein [Lachnospiraceae bacterium]|nr:CotH kinase family protein [Lachnospiraceae bacterium]